MKKAKYEYASEFAQNMKTVAEILLDKHHKRQLPKPVIKIKATRSSRCRR